MKQTLGELMRMSRICRMLFATCLGSFILVIFYFQSMFQPGRSFMSSFCYSPVFSIMAPRCVPTNHCCSCKRKKTL
uniref:Carbohydrate sulfotransferase n=1 Tax=Xiphophorus couchianus TaxID=32473 RepID=A0A3B5KZ04_9TELE